MIVDATRGGGRSVLRRMAAAAAVVLGFWVDAQDREGDVCRRLSTPGWPDLGGGAHHTQA